MRDVIEHYNKLIDENNDPARDPKPLRDYMDKWDGDKFIESMQLDKNQNEYIDMGDRKIKIYPDNPNDIRSYLSISNLKIINEFETDHAYVTVSTKASLV